MQVAQDRVQWWAFVNSDEPLVSMKKAGYFLIS
jgi:hypothetical protein